MLKARMTPGAAVNARVDGWRFEIPAGPRTAYRLAQLDDHSGLGRGRFPFASDGEFNLRCRVSAAHLPGTWGFGFWNDPFAVSFGLGSMARRLPALPNAAWFFHASPENYLSLRSDKPASGFLVATLSSPRIPSLLLVAGLLAAPLLLSKMLARVLRRAAARVMREDSDLLELDVTVWHEYGLRWQPGEVEFSVDGRTVFTTGISPRGPLGLVLWIDNQFAAFTPQGQIKAGTLENAVPAWMEIEGFSARRPG